MLEEVVLTISVVIGVYFLRLIGVVVVVVVVVGGLMIVDVVAELYLLLIA